jgi:hypothetical protein
MIYFVDCKTKEDATNRWKQWVKILHPDHGGKTEQFQKMQQEYEDILSGKVSLNEPQPEKKKYIIELSPNHSQQVKNYCTSQWNSYQ